MRKHLCTARQSCMAQAPEANPAQGSVPSYETFKLILSSRALLWEFILWIIVPDVIFRVNALPTSRQSTEVSLGIPAQPEHNSYRKKKEVSRKIMRAFPSPFHSSDPVLTTSSRVVFHKLLSQGHPRKD